MSNTPLIFNDNAFGSTKVNLKVQKSMNGLMSASKGLKPIQMKVHNNMI